MLFNSTHQRLQSQTLIVECNDQKSYKYSLLDKQRTPVRFYDSLSSFKSDVKFNGNTYEGDKCCMKFFIGDKVLFMRYCRTAVMKGSRILWSKGSIDCPTDCRLDSVHRCLQMDCEVVDFTKDNEWALMVDKAGPMLANRCVVAEVNINNGSATVYHRQTDKPSYSPDGQYLLMRSYRNNKKYYIYNRITKDIVATLRDVKRISWQY